MAIDVYKKTKNKTKKKELQILAFFSDIDYSINIKHMIKGMKERLKTWAGKRTLENNHSKFLEVKYIINIISKFTGQIN